MKAARITQRKNAFSFSCNPGQCWKNNPHVVLKKILIYDISLDANPDKFTWFIWCNCVNDFLRCHSLELMIAQLNLTANYFFSWTQYCWDPREDEAFHHNNTYNDFLTVTRFKVCFCFFFPPTSVCVFTRNEKTPGWSDKQSYRSVRRISCLVCANKAVGAQYALTLTAALFGPEQTNQIKVLPSDLTGKRWTSSSSQTPTAVPVMALITRQHPLITLGIPIPDQHRLRDCVFL